jgi:AraC-like DNA-binding protein
MVASSFHFAKPTRSIPVNPLSDRRTDEEILASEARWRAVGGGVQPYPTGIGFRADLTRVLEDGSKLAAQGYYDFVKVADGLIIRIVEAHIAASASSRSPGDDWLKIDLYTSGRQSLVFEGQGQIDVEACWCNVHLHPPGVDKGEWMDATPTSGVMLYVHPRYMARLFDGCESDLPFALRTFAEGREAGFIFERVAVSRSMARTINQVLNAPYAGGLRRLFLEGQCLDILTQVLAAMCDRAPDAPPQMRPRDRERIQSAKAILDADFANPPTIVELARKVGVNQQKLKVGFKEVVGTTISNYCQELRLAEAWRLLRDRDLSVTQVAFEVGYDFPTNFATAFKRRYGVSPNRFRRGA